MAGRCGGASSNAGTSPRSSAPRARPACGTPGCTIGGACPGGVGQRRGSPGRPRNTDDAPW
eukprot:12068309-Alexandrium_andersonii.AAC.1